MNRTDTDPAPTQPNVSRFQAIRSVFASISTFFFSRIGIALLVIGYAIAGGFLFKAIESPTEQRNLKIVRDSHELVINRLLNRSNEYRVLIKHDWIKMAREQLDEFQNDILTAVKQRGYMGRRNTDTWTQTVDNEQWNIAGAVLYAVTVITSIGYGNITCKTTLGRSLTMLYAIIGIPLMLVCLANIGSTMADIVRFVYSRVCCAYCYMVQRKRNLTQQDDDHHQKKMYARNQPVPISVTLMLLFGYIFLGAIFFSQWEEWSLLDGGYFCFITLSTIGLGDFVPGRSFSGGHKSQNASTNSEGKLALCAVYLTMGLSLLVMCFNLLQEEVRAKCRRIGIKLGIVDVKRILMK